MSKELKKCIKECIAVHQFPPIKPLTIPVSPPPTPKKK